MRFGFDLPTRDLALYSVDPSHQDVATRENLVAVACRGEELGFDSAWVADHIVIPTASTRYPYTEDGHYPFDPSKDFFEPIVTLAFLAGITRRLRIGVSVLIVPYRNPVMTAKMLATLDVLSGGRLTLGIGTGWWEEEYRALGLSTFGRRAACTDEYIRIFKELWTNDAPRFEGQFQSFADIRCNPKPAQKPHPPIWVGGHSDAALRRAVTHGNAWHPIALRKPVELLPEELGTRVRTLRAMLAAAGRGHERFDVCLRILLKFSPDAAPRPMTGPPAKVVEDLLAYHRAGVTHVVLDTVMDSAEGMMDTLERFATEVRPHVAKEVGPEAAAETTTA